MSDQDTIRGASSRQARLIDWLKHPTGLPVHPAIDPTSRALMFTAQEIVDESGLYESRRACLDDLNTLRRTLVVGKYGNRWRYEGWLR